MTNQELREKSKNIWRKYRQRMLSPTTEERGIMTAAYAAGVLPKDEDYSVDEWVEVGCPPFM